MKNISEKSRMAAFLLAWFLGCFGAHRFYTGKTGSAVAMLILTLTLVGIIITAIWAFIDGIVILVGDFTDKEGNIIKNW